MAYTKEDIVRLVREQGISFIRLQFTDIFGQLKHVAITASQLQKALKQCATGASALMLGDTESDGTAAHEAGALFYPILPGDEKASWKQFREEILPLFLAGKYDEAEEAKHIRRLKEMLA